MADILTSDQIERAAKLLTDARLAVTRIDSLGADAPSDIASAHSIAKAHADMLGWESIGWKVGCTSERAREILKCEESFPGRVFDGTVYGSQILHHDAIHNPLVESEFAFVLGHDLPPRETPYSIEEVKEATSAVIPAFEIVTSRFNDWATVGHLSLIADHGSNGGVVFGAPVLMSECPNLADVAVSLTIDGQQITTGSGAEILGDPWRSLQWLANDLSGRQVTLKAGEFVMSGTCAGAEPLPEGSTATAIFDGFGEVTISRTAPD